MKYSFASYLNVARPFPGASDCVELYTGPGPVTTADTDGSFTAVGVWGRLTAGAWPRPPCPRSPPWPLPCPCPCATAHEAAKTITKAAANTIARDLVIIVS